jgi:choline kinase
MNALSVIILCAGEGTRLKEVSLNFPKPIIKIPRIGKSVLELTLEQLLNANISKIFLIYGFEGEKFVQFVGDLEKSQRIDNLRLNDTVYLVNAEKKYKKGPFHSFLQILSVSNLNENIILIPGDTLYEDELIKSALKVVEERIKTKRNEPVAFYRILNEDKINHYLVRNKNIISVVNFVEREALKELRSIEKVDIRNKDTKRPILQMIPILFLPTNFLKFLEDLKINLENYSKLTDFINNVYLKEKKIKAALIERNNEFLELDAKTDMQFIAEKYYEILNIQEKKRG